MDVNALAEYEHFSNSLNEFEKRSKTMNSDPSSIAKVYKLLAEFSSAMLVTHAGNGLRARPMEIAQLQPDCTMWFITSENTAKAHEILENTTVQIVCQNDQSAYLSISATATLRRDIAKVQEIWKEKYQVWFPAGPTDPDIVLIEVQSVEAEYWDHEGLNGLNFLMQAAKAYATGTRADFKDDEKHGVVKL